ncbi:hypothetical protein [Micromonospora sp. ATA51]|uniref:hypothetical protein n=1 Tax=Micromonospora sp. ATA51 TaxID=2806098 RepID=UPI001A5293BB|nr:hypothetical protein [Micromonospora sp. ATA51]MBM0229186.1 hypothetical protein [Micromonospora sp. ATA51]
MKDNWNQMTSCEAPIKKGRATTVYVAVDLPELSSVNLEDLDWKIDCTCDCQKYSVDPNAPTVVFYAGIPKPGKYPLQIQMKDDSSMVVAEQSIAFTIVK